MSARGEAPAERDPGEEAGSRDPAAGKRAEGGGDEPMGKRGVETVEVRLQVTSARRDEANDGNRSGGVGVGLAARGGLEAGRRRPRGKWRCGGERRGRGGGGEA